MAAPENQIPLLSLHFVNAGTGSEMRASVFAPQLEPRFNRYLGSTIQTWITHYLIETKDGKVQAEIGGEDWLQAFLLAIEGVRIKIPKGEEGVWTTENGCPSWAVLPRIVPIAWGFDVYKEAVAAIEEIVVRKNREIESKREEGQNSGSK